MKTNKITKNQTNKNKNVQEIILKFMSYVICCKTCSACIFLTFPEHCDTTSQIFLV